MSIASRIKNFLGAQVSVADARRAAQVQYYEMAREALEYERSAMATAYGITSRLDTAAPYAQNYTFGPVNPKAGVGVGLVESSWNLDSCRNRSRNLEKQNLLACGVLDRDVENVIGTTFRIEPKSKDQAWNNAVRRWWKGWAHTTACDVRGRNTFGALLRLFYRAKKRDGDVGMILTMTGPPGQERPRLQIVQGERIQSPTLGQYQVPDGFQLVDGVEMDSYGLAVAYWITSGTSRVQQPTRVDARDFIFIARTNSVSTVRGEPAFEGGFNLFAQIMGYLESTVVAARVGASAAMVIKKKDPTAALNALGQPVAVLGTKPSKPTLERRYDVQPGGIHYMELDEEMQSFNPSQPTQQLPDAIRTFARFVGVKFGLTIEQVLLDFSQTNFSSGKMARIQANTTAQIEQEDIGTNVVSRVYQWAVSKAIHLGEIVDENDNPMTPPKDYWEHEWIPTIHPSPQPDKDIMVAEKAIALGVDARSYVALAMGYWFPDLCLQNQSDRALMTSLNLPINDGAAAPATAPAPAAESPTVDEEGKVIPPEPPK